MRGKNTNGGDMAFPVLDRTQTPNETYQLGLTKRELIAALVMQGALVREGHVCDIAAFSVRAADALLAALAE